MTPNSVDNGLQLFLFGKLTNCQNSNYSLELSCHLSLLAAVSRLSLSLVDSREREPLIFSSLPHLHYTTITSFTTICTALEIITLLLVS